MVDDMWVNTDEAEDVAGSVRHALRCADVLGEDPQLWKWNVLAIHSALQGACVCHLTTTAQPVGAVTNKNAEEWLSYFEQQRTDATVLRPKTLLMNLPELLKTIRKPNSAGNRSNEKGIPISDAELAWLTRIHTDFRNQFIHSAPTGWSIEVSGIPRIARLTARSLGDISDFGWAFRHLDDEKLDELRGDLQRLSQVEMPVLP